MLQDLIWRTLERRRLDSRHTHVHDHIWSSSHTCSRLSNPLHYTGSQDWDDWDTLYLFLNCKYGPSLTCPKLLSNCDDAYSLVMHFIGRRRRRRRHKHILAYRQIPTLKDYYNLRSFLAPLSTGTASNFTSLSYWLWHNSVMLCAK